MEGGTRRRQLAEICERYLHKGSKVYIEGRLTQRKYTDKEGVQRTAVEVIANDMQMLDSKQAGKQCEFCHITQGKKRTSKRTGNRFIVFLHAAHRDHDIGNPNPLLLCSCPTCHGKYDYRHRKRQQQINQERLKHQMLLTLRS